MRLLLLITIFLVVSFASFSQREKAGVIERNSRGEISSVELSGSSPEKIRAANDFFKQYLEVRQHDQFERVSKREKDGSSHERFKQFYKGVQVLGGEYSIHYKNGEMYFANGNYVNVGNLSVQPAITSKSAVSTFMKYKGIKAPAINPKIELLIMEVATKVGSSDASPAKLVYRIYLDSDDINNTEAGIVDAQTGKILATEPLHYDVNASFMTRYSGSQTAQTTATTGGYRLYDNSRGAIIHTRDLQNNSTNILTAIEFIDANNSWTSSEYSSNKKDMALDIHWGMQKIYDYFHNTYAYDSWNGANHNIESYFRYGTNWENAGFSTLGYFVFGQGGSNWNPAASLDIVSHEYAHGITYTEIGWGTSGLPRAFSEGLSDIWATVLQQKIRPNAQWQIAEGVMKNKSSLRNLANTQDNNAFDKILDTYNGPGYSSGDDYDLSGIFSHWFYVLANGETGTNDVGWSYSVTGIGMADAEKLIAEAVFNSYLGGTTMYSQLRTNTINAAKAIFCDNSPQVKAVTDAWHAVGVGAVYSGSAMSMTSANLVCSGSNVSINNVPSGASVNWSISPGLMVSPNSGSYTSTGGNYAVPLTAGYVSNGGTTTVSATISGLSGCSVSANMNRTFWFGYPSASFTAVYNTSHNWITFTPVGNTMLGITYEWSINGVYYNTGGSVIISYPPCGIIEATLTTTNSCGQSVRCQKYNFNCSTEGLSSLGACGDVGPVERKPSPEVENEIEVSGIEVYPNPVSDELFIKYNYPNKNQNTGKEHEIEIILLNASQQTVYSGKSTKKEIAIPVKNLADGIYYLKVTGKDGSLQRKINISH